ncbi:MAG TPA: Stp1/IreP family PP2C-type Ser/Thr phosphatase [Blastocatellia bacterium]|nr:Stp1/IreP family PP2C-type Ser/Thr phosphatase [Blastocatellia bacterium]
MLIPGCKVSVFACTDIGKRRSGNEDAFMVADLTTGNWGLGPAMRTHQAGERGTLLAVSDGMGGAVAGEVASKMAVDFIYQDLMSANTQASDYENLILATHRANKQIRDYAIQHPEFHGMGATLTAALVQDGKAYISQIGDSRAYLMRGKQIKQLTRDQSLVQQLIDAGVISEKDADRVPKNVILQALGVEPAVEVVMTTVDICRGDYLLLCSDGLSNKVTAEEMAHVLQTAISLPSACRSLVDLANERGGEDNITVVVAQFDGEALLPACHCPEPQYVKTRLVA